MDVVISRIRRALKKNADKKVKKSGERFFKEKIRLYGVKSAVVSRIGRESFKEVKGKGKEEIFALCEELWRSGMMEETFIACNWSYYVRQDYKPEDFKMFERWIKDYVSNWAACDTFCNHTVGDFLERYLRYVSELKRWARSKNRWMRRAAAVSLIVPGKHGKFLKEIFAIADILLCDDDDMVQKGYGWMLKVASQVHEKQIFDYVMKNKKKMPRTALRYAIEKMPKELKARAMAK